MASKLDDLFDGQVGEFWSLDNEFEPGAPLQGFVRRNDSGILELRTLGESGGELDWGDENVTQTPRFVAGLTATTGTILLRPSGSSRSKNYGGHRASTRDFRFRAIAAQVLVHNLKSGNLSNLEVHFMDMLRWAQMPVMQTEQETHEDGGLRSVTIRLDSGGRRDIVRLYDGISLHIHPHWSYTLNDAYSRVETSLAVGAVSTRPRSIETLIEPLTDFRLLLSLAHGVPVPCESARAQLDYRKNRDEDRAHWSPLWDQRLMEKPERAAKIVMPKFTYEAMGGAGGVARWMKFSRTHARFVRPVTMHPLYPGMAVTTRLMELYAAIEYYVAVGRREKKNWARERLAKAKILARHGGSEFNKLVGNVDRWADVLHWMNNRVKHDPVDYNPVDIYWLNESTEALVTIISLNYASQKKLAAQHFVSDHRTERIGRKVRALLARYPDELPKCY